MNRRALIFVLVFLTVGVAGLVYTYSIAPVYVASASVRVEAGSGLEPGSGAASFVLNEAHALTSNELLNSVLTDLRESKGSLRRFDTVPQLREVLSANVSPGSNIIELQARGHRHSRKRVARLLRETGRAGRTPRRWRTTTVPDPAATVPEKCARWHGWLSRSRVEPVVVTRALPLRHITSTVASLADNPAAETSAFRLAAGQLWCRGAAVEPAMFDRRHVRRR